MKKRNWKMDKFHKKKQKLAWLDMLEEIKKLSGKVPKAPPKSGRTE